jgi:hypothetical protein
MHIAEMLGVAKPGQGRSRLRTRREVRNREGISDIRHLDTVGAENAHLKCVEVEDDLLGRGREPPG